MGVMAAFVRLVECLLLASCSAMTPAGGLRLNIRINAAFESKLELVNHRLQPVKNILQPEILTHQHGVVFSTTSSFPVYRVTSNHHDHTHSVTSHFFTFTLV